MTVAVVDATPAGVRGAPATTHAVLTDTNVVTLKVHSRTNATSAPTVTTTAASTPTASDG